MSTPPLPAQTWGQSAPPMEIQLNTVRSQVTTLGAGAACLLLGAAALAAAAWDRASIVPLLLGVGFVGLGLVLFAGYFLVMRRRRAFIVEPQGLRYDCQVGDPWAVAWQELAACELTVAFHRGLRAFAHKTYRYRLILHPATPDFAQRHPELAVYAGRFGGEDGGYGFPLGTDGSIVDPLARALATHAGPRFRGVRDEGWVIGLGYL